MDCGNREPRSHVQARLDEELPPRCLRCGGIHMKPAAVFFGEAMPAEATSRAFQLAEECDLMLVIGSSLVVYPAAQVPLVAHDAGAALLILNAEPTPFDRLGDTSSLRAARPAAAARGWAAGARYGKGCRRGASSRRMGAHVGPGHPGPDRRVAAARVEVPAPAAAGVPDGRLQRWI